MKHAHDTVLTVAGVAGMCAAGLAALTIWLFLAQPLTIATAVTARDLSSLAHALAAAMSDVLETLFRYL